ncbi:hypothetical protein PIB30_111241 [Stylosanthes scabra]|uniref:Uncharacterized protein n=1 Tax=Stylosanthes scabra TaxID=79078 RepID=A0ABU6W0I0_9FABA|nr:hypothetical protein [Stylosanthes scabra]
MHNDDDNDESIQVLKENPPPQKSNKHREHIRSMLALAPQPCNKRMRGGAKPERVY